MAAEAQRTTQIRVGRPPEVDTPLGTPALANQPVQAGSAEIKAVSRELEAMFTAPVTGRYIAGVTPAGNRTAAVAGNRLNGPHNSVRHRSSVAGHSNRACSQILRPSRLSTANTQLVRPASSVRKTSIPGAIGPRVFEGVADQGGAERGVDMFLLIRRGPIGSWLGPMVKGSLAPPAPLSGLSNTCLHDVDH